MTWSRSGRRQAAPIAGLLLVGGCLALAALSLLAPSSPSYDPFAWIVWGRELVTPSMTFSVAGGPSWKPLPVLFTAVFAAFGGAAPALWLLVARAGALLALAGAWRLGARLAGRWAGALAALGVLVLAEVVSLAWRGASEPLMLACLLWAIERHLAGRRTSAFALGVAAALIRPEVLPFLALYAVACWREADARARWVLAGGLALVPLLWLGPPGLTGDPFAASSTAGTGHHLHHPAWTALRRGLRLASTPVWVLALAALVLRPRDRVLQALALGAAAWLALIVVMTAAGYAGEARYMLPTAAVACVLAAVGAVALVQRARWLGALAVLIALLLGASRAGTVDDQVREGVRVAHVADQLRGAVAQAGGTAAVRRCALGGWLAINHTTRTTLAWELRVPLDRVAERFRQPGVLIWAPGEMATGKTPPILLRGPLARRAVARAGIWHVETVRSARAPLPRACALG